MSLFQSLDAGRLSQSNPCDALFCLGSYWPYAKHSRESHLVKGFKECVPASDYHPHIVLMCEAYAALITIASPASRSG